MPDSDPLSRWRPHAGAGHAPNPCIFEPSNVSGPAPKAGAGAPLHHVIAKFRCKYNGGHQVDTDWMDYLIPPDTLWRFDSNIVAFR
jgi:hypothetical protein